MSKYRIVIRDTVELAPAQVADSNKTFLSDFNSQNENIIIKMAATHAGKITKNNGFYLPDKMKAGVATFTKDFNKPVLTHHSDHQDPIGRIVSAKYVDISNKAKVLNGFNNELLRINDESISFIHKIFIIQNSLTSQLSDDKNYQGLGYAEVTARISDSDAVDKLKDGRYLTVSIGASSDKAVCSICSRDWSETGTCGHHPGRYYKKNKDGDWVEDKKKESSSKETVRSQCFLIYGDLFYDEISFINRPADTIAKVIEIQTDDGVIDSIEFDGDFEHVIADYFLSNKKEQTMFSLSDSTQTNLLNLKEKEDLKVMSDKIKEEGQQKGVQNSDSSEDLIKKFDDGTLKIESTKEREHVIRWHDSLHWQFDPFRDSDSEVAKEALSRMSDAHKELHAKLHKLAMSDGFRKDFINGPLDMTLENYGVKDSEQPDETNDGSETVQDDNTETQDETPEDQQKDAAPDGSTETQDKPTEFSFDELDLEKLSEKDFAETNRDLIYEEMVREMEAAAQDGTAWYRRNGDEVTVEDAKLSTAQRKKLSSSTFCGPNRSFPVPDCAHVTAARRLIGRAKVGSATKARILACVNRKAKAMGCGANKSRDAYSDEKLESISDKQLEQLYRKIDEELVKRELCPLATEIEQNEQLTKKADELDERVEALKKELELAWQDAEEAQSKLADVLQDRHKDKAVALIDMKLLSGEKIEDRDQAVEEETKKSSDVLDGLIKEVREKLDLSKISDKLNDGTARVPQGTVEDPTTNGEDLVSDDNPSEAGKDQSIADAKEVYYRFKALKLRNPGTADTFLKDMESRGFISKDLFDKFEKELSQTKNK
jgi:hypothetical protein